MIGAPAVDPGRPTLRIRGTSYPVLLPSLRDPRLHLAVVIVSLQVLGPGRVRVPALDRTDPRRARHVRGARGRHRVPAPEGDPVARERAPDGERRRLHPARARNRARRLVEHARLVDLRRHGRGGAALEVPDHVPRASRLQPLELRPRPLLPPARPGEGRSARVLVGADVGVDGPRARDHRRRRVRDPAAAPPAAHRGRLLGRIRGGTRGAGGERSRDDGALAPRPDLRVGVLAHARLLARGPRVPVLHDHRPQDDPRDAPAGAARTRSGSGCWPCC